MNIKVLLLAAGEGTRMKSNKAKVLHKVAGKAMIEWVSDSVSEITDKPVLIYGSKAEQIEAEFGDRFEYVLQSPRLGTGHAVICALDSIKGSDYTLVMAGDMPLIKKETVEALLNKTVDGNYDCIVVTATPANPFGFGRIIRGEDGRVSAIVEEKDADAEQKKINEVNTSVYCFKTESLINALGKINNNNKQNEYYLTDCINILYSEGKKVDSLIIEDIAESMGVNNRVQLAQVGKVLRSRINEMHMMNGVTLIDPDNTYIDAGVAIGKDTVIYPGVILEGNTVIGEANILYQGSRISNCKIGNDTIVENSVLTDSEVGSGTTVGPNAYLRPHSKIGDGCRIGDFVETKNVNIGNGTKVSHLTYVGDADLGEDINIGCGVVFVNYDGQVKSRSTVGDGAFIGCNTNLIAPVNVGENAYIAAATTVTKDIPDNAFAIGRSRQLVKEEWAKGRYKHQKENK